jgi:hypothetical protein
MLPVAVCLCLCTPAAAIEGPTAAGPIGGTDIRSALIPPPGLYGGFAAQAAGTRFFAGPDGKTNPVLREAALHAQTWGPILYYVPQATLLGGALALEVVLPFGHQCGSLFVGERNACGTNMGDPYVEFEWARIFGKERPARTPGAFPILQGLSVMLAFGVVIPAGPYDAATPLTRALSTGTNIWDFAPSIAITYTTRPILADGTELSAKLFWNNYLENPATHYLTGDLINVDFALTEHIGRWQAGLTGYYARQIEDDELFGVSVPPGGNRALTLQLGGIVAYDIPEREATLKLKVTNTAYVENTVSLWTVVASWYRKF